MSMTQQYREKLQYIFETTHGCIAICSTADNTLEAVNSSFARMHGYEPDELVGISLDELAASDSIRYLSEGKNASSTYLFDTLSFEATHKRKEGSTFPVSINITVIKDENGAIRNRIVTLQDISEDETLQKCNQTYPESKKTTETKVEAENTKTFSEKMFDPQKMSSLLLSNMLKKIDAKEREFRSPSYTGRLSSMSIGRSRTL